MDDKVDWGAWIHVCQRCGEVLTPTLHLGSSGESSWTYEDPQTQHAPEPLLEQPFDLE